MPAGRKNKYDSRVKPRLKAIAAWCRNGMIEKEICRRLGISEQTFNVYKKQFPELLESLRQNKEIADAEVENALFQNCLGREVREITETEFKDAGGGKAVTKTVIKQLAGNVAAQKFWLLNRQPQKYRQKINVDASVKDRTELEKQKRLLDSLPLAERIALLKDMDNDE